MTPDFFLGQLRLIAVALIAFATGKGWLSSADSTMLGAILPPVGLLIGPWLWSVYANVNRKLVPHDSVAVSKADVVGVAVVGTTVAVPGAVKVVGAILILVVSTALLLPGPAVAQSRRATLAPTTDTAADPAADQKCALIWDPLHLCGKLTGNVETDLKRVADRIRQVKKDDLAYAILKATKAGTPTAKVRLQCMTAVQDAAAAWDGDQIKDASGAVVPRPDPALITSIEDTAELVDALSPQGALFSSCAGAAQMFAIGTLQVINAIVTGTAMIIPKA